MLAWRVFCRVRNFDCEVGRASCPFPVPHSLDSKEGASFWGGGGTSGNTGTGNVTVGMDSPETSDCRETLDRAPSSCDAGTSPGAVSSGVRAAETEVAEEASNDAIAVDTVWASVCVCCERSGVAQAAETAQPAGCFRDSDIADPTGKVESGNAEFMSDFEGSLHIAVS